MKEKFEKVDVENNLMKKIDQVFAPTPKRVLELQKKYGVLAEAS